MGTALSKESQEKKKKIREYWSNIRKTDHYKEWAKENAKNLNYQTAMKLYFSRFPELNIVL